MSSDKILTDKEQEDYLKSLHTSKQFIKFTYPEEPKNVHFRWIESFVSKDPCGRSNVNYWNVIDIMESIDKNCPDSEKVWLRLTYWRYKTAESVFDKNGKRTNRRWVIAGQTSLSNPISTFEDFFVQAIKEKEWIRPLFKKILERCIDELSIVPDGKI